MRVRPLDEQGDYIPIYNTDQMITGKDAVAQVVNVRLQFYYGEWWEDRTLGFRAPEFLVNSARSGDTNLLSKYIASYISGTEGVRAVTDIVSTMEEHVLRFYCRVITNEGTSGTVEVDLDGIL